MERWPVAPKGDQGTWFLPPMASPGYSVPLVRTGVGWLILCVNLIRLKGARVAGKILFLSLCL